MRNVLDDKFWLLERKKQMREAFVISKYIIYNFNKYFYSFVVFMNN